MGLYQDMCVCVCVYEYVQLTQIICLKESPDFEPVLLSADTVTATENSLSSMALTSTYFTSLALIPQSTAEPQADFPSNLIGHNSTNMATEAELP